MSSPRAPSAHPSSPRSTASFVLRTPSSALNTPSRGDVRSSRLPRSFAPGAAGAAAAGSSGSGGPAPRAIHAAAAAADGAGAEGGAGSDDQKHAQELQHVDPSSADGSRLLTQEVVWGTTVNVGHSMAAFRRFIEQFVPARSQEPLYPRLIREIVEAEIYNINIDCMNLHRFDRVLYNELVRYPSELIPIFDLAIHDYITEKFPEQAAERSRRTQVRTFHLSQAHKLRELNPEDIDKMVSIRGMVIRCSQIIPDLQVAFFRCLMCDEAEQVMVDRGRIAEPTSCRRCMAKNSMQMVHNRSNFSDKQLIRLQETPDSIPEGETPHTINVFAYDDLVDVAKPGDRVEVTGIYKARAHRPNSRQRTIRSIFQTYIDVIHFKKSEKRTLSAEDPYVETTSEFFTPFEESDEVLQTQEEEDQALRTLAADPNIYDRLVKSLAPSIYQMDDIKRGILCQLFGGTNKTIGDYGRARGEINILLCGDPGTSKSQLLQYVHKIAPRGIYTSGKGSSAVGLTAYVTKDPTTRELVLESGALVLSDRGVCCIDEFDKMSDSTRSILHEVMEQQTVSIAKAGIVCSLNARTSVLASANPKWSRYDPTKSVVENMNLPPTLLSRFDLIYLVLDQPNEMNDRRLARHVVSLYYETQPAQQSEFIPMDTLTKYISFARKHIHPEISNAAVDQLINAYVSMRKIGYAGARKMVTATPRQLESLIRLAEALARMRYSQHVTEQDVKEAERLMTVATQTAATDPTTGLIDMDLITTGRSAAERSIEEKQLEALRALVSQSSGRIRFSQLLEQFNAQSDVTLTARDLDKLVKRLEEEKYVTVMPRGREKEVVRL